jgi:hypothetical protein
VAQSAGRLCYTSGRAWLRRPDGRVTRLDARGLSACLRGSASLDGVNEPSGRGPHNFIKPGRRISKATSQFSHLFLLLVSDFLPVFAFSRPLLSFCALLTTFQVLFLVNFILFSFF